MKINYRDMVFNFDDERKGIVSFGIQGVKEKEPKDGYNLVSLDCMEYGMPYYMAPCGSTTKRLTLENTVTSDENGFEYYSCYDKEYGKFGVTSNVEYIEGINLVRQSNRVVNEGDKKGTLTHVSSVYISGLDGFGDLNWNDEGKFKIYYCRSGWSKEGQWFGKTPAELDIYPGCTGNAGFSASVQFTSKGSWTTAKYYPMVVIEDLECGVCYYFEVEDMADWTIEVGHTGVSNGEKFYVEVNGSDIDCTNWKYELAPGEEYKTPSVVYGCIKGGFESAIRELTKFKRKDSMFPWPNKTPYLVFNDWCALSGIISDKNSIPLIDAAAEAGSEVYCIDDGWFAKCVDGYAESPGKKVMGAWMHNDELFGDYGFKGIIDYINSKGMIAGAWTELEFFHEGTPLYDEGLYLRQDDGTPLFAGGRRLFADMTNPRVQEYLEEVIDRLYNLGIRYIKNDYNGSSRIGLSIDGKCSSESNRILLQATKSFFVKVRTKYPDLIIENCASGAMRSDNSTLKIFNLQSTSDEGVYYLNPTVAAGSAAIMPPEKAGNWAYPYNPSYNKSKFDTPEYYESMKDGEQTIFNMINGLCGTMYLSGRIDVADEYNFALVKEGVQVFKKYREHIMKSYPIYPCGMVKRDFKNTCFGLISEDNKKITLAVWRLSDTEKCLDIDLSKYGNVKDVKLVYPSNERGVSYSYKNNILSVEMDNVLSARYFEIVLA